MRRGVLDRLLAAGADPCWDPELTLRAAQISAPRRRRALEKSLGQAVRDAHRPGRWTCAAPIARSAIRATAPELRALAAEVSREPAPPPQAIALTDQLVRDPGSPLYAPGNEGALRETVRIARSSLRDHTDPTRGDTLRPEGDDVGSRDFRFGATGLLLIIAIAVAFAILS
jgi:hypothetical protein